MHNYLLDSGFACYFDIIFILADFDLVTVVLVGDDDNDDEASCWECIATYNKA